VYVLCGAKKLKQRAGGEKTRADKLKAQEKGETQRAQTQVSASEHAELRLKEIAHKMTTKLLNKKACLPSSTFCGRQACRWRPSTKPLRVPPCDLGVS